MHVPRRSTWPPRVLQTRFWADWIPHVVLNQLFALRPPAASYITRNRSRTVILSTWRRLSRRMQTIMTLEEVKFRDFFILQAALCYQSHREVQMKGSKRPLTFGYHYVRVKTVAGLVKEGSLIAWRHGEQYLAESCERIWLRVGGILD